LKGGFLSLQTSLSSRNFPPRAPAYAVRSFVSLCMGRVLLGESFCRLGRWGIFAGCGFAPDWWAGCAGRVYAFCKCRLIPPHQSLTRQLPPEGKPSFRCANIANKISGSNRITNINRRPNSCISFLLYKTERNFEKASPWVGRKLQAVCRDSD